MGRARRSLASAPSVGLQGHAQSCRCEIEVYVAWKAPTIARSKQPIGCLDQRDLRFLRLHMSFCGLGSTEETVPSLGWSGPGMWALLARAAWWRRATTLGRFPASRCVVARLLRAMCVWGWSGPRMRVMSGRRASYIAIAVERCPACRCAVARLLRAVSCRGGRVRECGCSRSGGPRT